MKSRIFLLFLLLWVTFSTINAEITLPTIFQSNMLLQQRTTVRIWGKATPNKKISLLTSWALKRYRTTSDAQGNWEVEFTTPRAGGPHSITITDGQVLTLSNILIGELWLCSGQSNMEMPMKGFPSQPVEGSNMDLLRSENSQIRLFTVKRNANIHPQDEVSGRWEEAMPISVRDFSATAYYFGRLLQETLKVPVGLINASWGGSSIEAWMSADMLRAFPEAVAPTTNEGVKDPNRKPTMLYQAMIHPIIDMPVKGVIWYQGESNADRSYSYANMFKAMVEGWREKMKEPNPIPFYFCQIAPYKYNNLNSAYLREAQLKATKQVEHTGMAVLMDTGESNNIHPAKKREAGERLALLALNKTYNFQGITAESPTFKDIEIRNDTIIVNFDGAPMGLSARNFQSELFMVAGEDRVFHPATTARINRSRIIVKSDKVDHPIAVRYAFDDFVVGDLFSTEGLPVSSFRSDSW